MADWETADAGAGASPNTGAGASPNGGAAPSGSDEIADRTAVITARLKTIYRKTVLPVEKRYRYDYFYESPLMTDAEFDGEEDDRGADIFCLVRK